MTLINLIKYQNVNASNVFLKFLKSEMVQI